MAESQTFYPRPRLKRPGPTPRSVTAAPAAAAAPTSHVIPFRLKAAVNTRSCGSSGKLRGPAIVTGIHMTKGGAAVGSTGLEVGKSATPITEANVAASATRAWTPLYDTRVVAGTIAVPGGEVDESIDFQTSLYQDDTNLGIVILDAEFYLVIVTYSGGAGSNEIAGHVTLLEQVSPQALANFL